MDSPNPLWVSVDAKLGRAEEHFEELQRSFADIGKDDAYRVVFQHNADSTEVAMWVIFEPTPGVRWGTIIGDFAANLRASLDHAVYAIAIKESGQNPPPSEKRLQFPITDRDTDWDKSNASGRIKTLDGPVRAFIKSVQPFEAPQSAALHPLSFVGALTDRDKHREILVGASLAQEIKFDFPGPVKPRAMKEVLAWQYPVVDKAPLVIFKFSEPNPNVAVNVQFRFRVILNIDGVWRPAIAELERIRSGVIGVVDGLRSFVS